jgi:hypothetical protein
MENLMTAQAEGYRFISKEQIDLIQELKGLCYFVDSKKRKKFLNFVCLSVGSNSIQEIKDVDFGTAYLTALNLLHIEGERIFKPQRNNRFDFISK